MKVVKFKDEFGEEHEFELSKDMIVASKVADLILKKDKSTHLHCYFLAYNIFAILKRNGVSLKALYKKDIGKKKGTK